MKKIYINKKAFVRMFFLIMLYLCGVSRTTAFQLSVYGDSSVLSEGKWVKISVPKSGVYLITNEDLKKWGFSDPLKVNVYGYGAQRLPDVLQASRYIDDLPVVQSKKISRGVVFYAQGPESWERTNGRFRHSINPFTTEGYYFISDRELDTECVIPENGVDSDFSNVVNSFEECIYHEIDKINEGETGHLMLGEDFKYNPSQSFHFKLTDIVNEEDVWMECQFAAKTLNSSSKLSFAVNGEVLPSQSLDNIPSSTTSAYTHGKLTTTNHNFKISGDEIILGIKHISSVTVVMAHLDYICLNYIRKLKMHNGVLSFRSSDPQMLLNGATQATHVWDVTKPLEISSLKTVISGGDAKWHNEYSGLRNYVAWAEDANIPSPKFVENIANQNLHGIEVPNMVIFTNAAWKSEAERIAELHRNSADSLKVAVVVQDNVFNEFSSGSPDANAFRMMLKMLWDRSVNEASSLQYALFMGRPTYDNRHLSEEVKVLGFPTMPTWQTDKGLDDNESYTTDDVYAFLRDNSGANMGTDYYCIAVGRMPVRSVNEAKEMVDKLYRYVNESPKDEWKNQIMLIADDMDNGIHMAQTESVYGKMMGSKSGKDFFYNKVYIDAFIREGSSYPQARAKMFRLLDEGVLWWNYVGHANTTSWTGEGILSYTDMSNMYLKKYPMLYAATCDFLRWDANALSGAEVMYGNSSGGVIAAISATRPVYISNNGNLSNAIAPFILSRDDDGKYLTIGEIYRRGKNNLYDINGKKVSDRNKLRYVLMGDPAMRLAIPELVAKVDSINGIAVDSDEQKIIKSRQIVKITGHIAGIDGNIVTDFDGTINSTLYDAEKSTTSHGYTNGDDGKEVTFEEQGSKLYAGRDSVKNGRFVLKIAMPTEIANNFRPAALNMYAQSGNGLEAIGCNRDFYVYGFDELAEFDTIPPTIDYCYLNSEDFVNGDVVNESPMIIAAISDNVGINLSSSGVGHQMSLRLDDEKSYSDVSLYYTPMIGERVSGVINYPIENLADGNHTLRLKVWDTSGNSAEKTINLVVENGLAPKVIDVYSDANPAYTETNFYVRHNRPDAMMMAQIEVYDLMGRTIWKSEKTAQSDMSILGPINWNLCDMSGRRVDKGIYLYRASISTDGVHYESEVKKIAVSAQ